MGKKTEDSKKTYDAMAAGYDISPEGGYTRAHRAELMQNVVLHDGEKLLDVACGNGALLGELTKKARVTAYGIDVSDNMIAIARQRHPNCAFFAGPCAPTGFGDGSMDAITVSCAFHHFEDAREFVAECRRILRKGGRVYLAEPNFSPLLRFVANRFVFPLARTGDVHVYGQRELNALFAEAGFTDLSSYKKGSVLFFSAANGADCADGSCPARGSA